MWVSIPSNSLLLPTFWSAFRFVDLPDFEVGLVDPGAVSAVLVKLRRGRVSICQVSPLSLSGPYLDLRGEAPVVVDRHGGFLRLPPFDEPEDLWSELPHDHFTLDAHLLSSPVGDIVARVRGRASDSTSIGSEPNAAEPRVVLRVPWRRWVLWRSSGASEYELLDEGRLEGPWPAALFFKGLINHPGTRRRLGLLRSFQCIPEEVALWAEVRERAIRLSLHRQVPHLPGQEAAGDL